MTFKDRHDHTAWLTHFVRDRVPEQDFPGETEEEYNFYAGGELKSDATAFDVLKTIIRLGGIRPGYSFRKGRTTICGGSPAVCATEMPIYSLAVYARTHATAKNVSAYGIAFLKSEFYKAGGRPAIYGLSPGRVTYKQNDPYMRIFEEEVLPIKEQYRYVAYNPGGSIRPIDWSHEREWRWIANNEKLDEIWVRDHDDIIGPTPALPIFKGQIDGRSFTQLCIIVWSASEADEIRSMLTGIYLAGNNIYDTPFDKTLIKRSRIIILEDVVAAVEKTSNIYAQTIEGLTQAQLLQPITITTPPSNAKQTVAAAMASAKQAANAADAVFQSQYSETFVGYGHAHAVTYEVTNPIVQYMLTNKMASGPYDGAVWIDFPGSPGAMDKERAENMCDAAASALSVALGIVVQVESTWD